MSDRMAAWLRARSTRPCPITALHAENDQRVGVLELVAFEAARVQDQAAIERERDRGNHERREAVLREAIQLIQRARQDERE